MLRDLPPITDPNVLVGTATFDDAGIYRISEELALVQTVDFFTPIVDDPFTYGRIAAANALSDVYAMGGRPVTALNIAAFPVGTLPDDVFAEILRGGADACREAGVSIIGGHTVKDDEPKFGMAVTGFVDPRRILRNDTARAGDQLFLTKPLGTGIYSTALKHGVIGDDVMEEAVRSMAALNARSSEAALEAGAHACTDITGFGFLGHAHEMAVASGVTFEIDARALPLFSRTTALIEAGEVPGGTKDNASQHAAFVRFDQAVGGALRLALSDAQTSGGLLIAVPPAGAAALAQALERRGQLVCTIGRAREGSGGEIVVLA
ncbi:selenide, water dikinase SelD [bacterium]|nr:MAG: selenide, water dikinase SelD [bacterium]